MSSEIRCDTSGCTERIVIEVPSYITQYTASELARKELWLVQPGTKRDFHYCPVHGRSLVAIVLRFAAGDGRGDPPGVHVALRELDAYEVREAVWAAYYAAVTEMPLDAPERHRDKLLEAARIAANEEPDHGDPRDGW